MAGSTFFPKGEGLSLDRLAELVSGTLEFGAGEARSRIRGVASLAEAESDDIALFDNPRYLDDLASTRAGCVLVGARLAEGVPQCLSRIVVAKDASAAFGAIGRALFPAALAPGAASGEAGISPHAFIHPEARLEKGVVVEPFAVIGPRVEVGEGTIIGPGVSIGAGCRVGRECRIGAQVSLSHAFVGNRVILHPGVRAGQDGFGYTAGPTGLLKSVQIGRVIIQDDVEIGANSTIDRGAVRDTVVGEGTKIDNQVQVGHNVVVGRNCVIVAQVGISGSVTIGDNVMIGGQTGINGHVTIGTGAQVAAVSSVAGDVPRGARWGGTPAKPVREWFKEVTLLSELARKRRPSGRQDDE